MYYDMTAECLCPGPTPTSTPPTSTMFPQPPLGCTVFEPPQGGALVCMVMEGTRIFCSVMCSNQTEFSITPCNPINCGAMTRFQWRDFFNGIKTESDLPKCSGKDAQ